LGRGGGGAARGSARCTLALPAEGEEARGGEGVPGSAARRGQGGRGGRLEVGDAPDRWAPPVSEREREERGGGPAGAVGPGR
jgi:hypothetical protein